MSLVGLDQRWAYWVGLDVVFLSFFIFIMAPFVAV